MSQERFCNDCGKVRRFVQARRATGTNKWFCSECYIVSTTGIPRRRHHQMTLGDCWNGYGEKKN